jgi:hypothetical protein
VRVCPQQLGEKGISCVFGKSSDEVEHEGWGEVHGSWLRVFVKSEVVSHPNPRAVFM